MRTLHRVICARDQVPDVGPHVADWTADAYRGLRIQLGISEGKTDHILEKSLPLESNLDYTNGGWRCTCPFLPHITSFPAWDNYVCVQRLSAMRFDLSLSL